MSYLHWYLRIFFTNVLYGKGEMLPQVREIIKVIGLGWRQRPQITLPIDNMFTPLSFSYRFRLAYEESIFLA